MVETRYLHVGPKIDTRKPSEQCPGRPLEKGDLVLVPVHEDSKNIYCVVGTTFYALCEYISFAGDSVWFLAQDGDVVNLSPKTPVISFCKENMDLVVKIEDANLEAAQFMSELKYQGVNRK